MKLGLHDIHCVHFSPRKGKQILVFSLHSFRKELQLKQVWVGQAKFFMLLLLLGLTKVSLEHSVD